MKNEESLASSDNLVYLCNISDQESISSNFRSKLIGGLNEEDVKNYIGTIENKYMQIEQEMKREMQELISSRNKLHKELTISKTTAIEDKKSLLESLEKAQLDLAVCTEECKNKDLAMQSLSDKNNAEIAQLHNKVNQMAEKRAELEKQLSASRLSMENIMESTAGLKQENNVLKLKIVDFEEKILSGSPQEDIDKIIQELEQQIEIEKSHNVKQNNDLEIFNQKIISLEETIAENIKVIEEHRKINEKTEQELKLEKARSSNYKINKFKDEIENIYQQLEELTTEQVNINNELQHQLEVEQLRANKAENELAELLKWVSELKDKLYNEQNLFETQFKQLAERNNQFHSEINGCFSYLQDLCNL